MSSYLETRNLAVGYDGHMLIHDIDIEVPRGSVTTLIGPNGAGKSTILKTITGHLKRIAGTVVLDGDELSHDSGKELAKKLAVVLTDRVRPDLMTCAEVAAMGRYPYTNAFGKLTAEDVAIVENALRRVHATDIADRDFTEISDGQRQRILLARAICQEPQIIVLDEPTAYLDIRHKIELLEILRDMAHSSGVTVVMSLHEIDLAMKVSDRLLCIKGDTIYASGTPESIIREGTIEQLYDMERGSFSSLFGSVELPKADGKPKVFVVCGAGFGIDCFRNLQKRGIPFATGIVYENDVDFHVARALASEVVSAPPFEIMDDSLLDRAVEIMKRCDYVIDAGTPAGSLNALNGKLLEAAEKNGTPVRRFHK